MRSDYPASMTRSRLLSSVRPNEVYHKQTCHRQHHETPGNNPLQAADFLYDVLIELLCEELVNAQSPQRRPVASSADVFPALWRAELLPQSAILGANSVDQLAETTRGPQAPGRYEQYKSDRPQRSTIFCRCEKITQSVELVEHGLVIRANRVDGLGTHKYKTIG